MGVVEKLGKRVKALGHQRAFVVTDKGVVAAGVVARVEASLKKAGIHCQVFDGVSANPTAACVEAVSE